MRYFFSHFFAQIVALFLTMACALGFVSMAHALVIHGSVNDQMVDEIFEYIKKNSLYPIYFEDGCREEIRTALYGYNIVRMTSVTACFGDIYSSIKVIEKNLIDDESFQKVGIGVGVVYGDMMGAYRVAYVYKDGPAYSAGLRDDDHLILIYNSDLNSSYIPQAINGTIFSIFGKIGSSVFVTVRRNGIIFTIGPIVRRYIKQRHVFVKELENGMGYILIKRFGDGAAKELREALLQFSKEGKHPRVIIDIRDNPGGYTDEAFMSLVQFSKSRNKVLLRYHGQDGIEKLLIAGPMSAQYPEFDLEGSMGEFSHYRIALLINENSASAADFFAAVIKLLSSKQDFVVIGERSYGKGLEQEYEIFFDNVLVVVTRREYRSGNGAKIHGVGVTPHCMAQDAREYFNDTLTHKDRQAFIARSLLESNSKMSIQCVAGKQ